MGQICPDIRVVNDFSTPLSSIDTSLRQKINKHASELNYIIDQMYLPDTYRIFHPIAVEYTFFSAAYRHNSPK
jgi:hypothetical protein